MWRRAVPGRPLRGCRDSAGSFPCLLRGGAPCRQCSCGAGHRAGPVRRAPVGHTGVRARPTWPAAQARPARARCRPPTAPFPGRDRWARTLPVASRDQWAGASMPPAERRTRRCTAGGQGRLGFSCGFLFKWACTVKRRSRAFGVKARRQCCKQRYPRAGSAHLQQACRHAGKLAHMAKPRTVYVCAECGGTSPKWQGKCPHCSAWNTLQETVEASGPAAASHRYAPLASSSPVRSLADIEARETPRQPTGLDEFDRVLGGGLVAGAVVLIGGDPGIGKSTLLLQALATMSAHSNVLYVTGEESAEQVALRARRLGLQTGNVNLLAEIRLEAIQAAVSEQKPVVAVI